MLMRTDNEGTAQPSLETFDRERGPKFAKMYETGFDRIIGLAENPVAMKLWAFFAKHADYHNAVVCGLEVLTEETGVSEKTVRRAVQFLVQKQAVSIGKAGTTNVYILNPMDVWKTYEENRKYCMFGSKTILSKKHNKHLKQRLTFMMTGEEPTQPNLFDE